MPRSQAHLELNSFVKGLITEASPLNFPENATIDESNFVLNTDGTRDRRLGMDYEAGYSILTSDQAIPSARDTVFQTFNWEGVAGDPTLRIAVIQIGSKVSFFDTTSGAISANKIGADFEIGTGDLPYGFASVDGILVAVTNEALISVFTYNAGVITLTNDKLIVRDLFGVADVLGGKDLYAQENISLTVDTLNPEHLYNLSNQSFGMPRANKLRGDAFFNIPPNVPPPGNIISTEFSFTGDPILAFYTQVGKYPSNAHSVHVGVYSDPTATPPEFKFYPQELINQPAYNAAAAKGFFLIDVLNRGSSRLEQYQANRDKHPTDHLIYPLNVLRLDRTTNGAKVVEEFSGRVFYAGFDGEVINGDSRSPDLSSYVLFSKLVDTKAEIGQCYQEGDPTDSEATDLVATDGGFIRVQGAYGIKKLINVGSALLVIADNGVWAIRGESGIGFSAVAYEVFKVSDRGCVSANSVVAIENTVLYWSGDGIYSLSPDQFGVYNATNITHSTIKKLYNGISVEDKLQATGVFDTFQRAAVWTYGGRLGSTEDVKQLILDTTLEAFYKYDFKTPTGSLYPRVVGSINVPPFVSGSTVDEVVVSGEQVQAGGVDVQVSSTIRSGTVRQVKYLTVTGEDGLGKPQYTFSSFKDQDFIDWKTFDGVGVDANAYMITGHLTGGDSTKDKQVPSVTFNFKKTEDGYTLVGDDLIPLHPSSCKVQARWDWSDSVNSNRWGREFQAYRHRRHYMPPDISDKFNNGFETVTSRSTLRGKGKALSLLIKTEPLKDLRLLGWSQDMLVHGRD